MTRASTPALDAVLFDFYGTLAEAVDWGPSLDDVLAGHGYSRTESTADWWGVQDGTDHSAHSATREAYVAWERHRLGLLADASGVPASRRDAVIEDLHAATKTFSLAVYDDVPPVLDALHARGVRIAVCSNWDWDLPGLVSDLGLAGAFEVVITSARVGARKPHPRIYAETLAALGVEPARALFVGDSLHADVEGPLDFGMRAVHVDRGGEADGDLPDGAVRVETLAALKEVL